MQKMKNARMQKCKNAKTAKKTYKNAENTKHQKCKANAENKKLQTMQNMQNLQKHKKPKTATVQKEATMKNKNAKEWQTRLSLGGCRKLTKHTGKAQLLRRSVEFLSIYFLGCCLEKRTPDKLQ